MIIELPDAELESLRLTREQARLELAVGLYAGGHVTMSRAARVSGVPYATFMQEVGRRGLCINYSEQDALDDIEHLRQQSPR